MRFPTPLVSLLFVSLTLGVNAEADPGSASGQSGSLEPPTLKPIVAKANLALSTGKFSEAITGFTDAIELSPIDYLLFYKRAMAYMSLSRHPQALDDFESVIKLSKGSVDRAYLMKGQIYVKEAMWKEAREAVLKLKTKEDKDTQNLLFSVVHGEKSHREALLAKQAKNWDGCIEHASAALESASHSIPIRQLRADCSLEKGDVDQGVADMTRLMNLMAPSTEHYLRLATMSYHLLPPTQTPPQAIMTIKQCLHGDPDSKPCAAAHRTYKNLEKSFTRLQALKDVEQKDPREVANYIEGNVGLLKKYIETLQTEFAALEPPLPASIDPLKKSERLAMLYRTLCRSYVDMKQVRKGEQYCDSLLAMDGFGNDVEGLVGRGEACLVKEEWEEAVRVFEKAFEASGRASQDVQQRLQRAQRQLKQARKKDYYKVLNVSRDADERTIKKAYKAAARIAHPDKGGSEERMAAVNEAYEVLSSPELRQRFDNGDDPNDPTSGNGGHPFFQQGGGNPFVFFQQGGHGHGPGSPFGGSGGSFSFSF